MLAISVGLTGFDLLVTTIAKDLVLLPDLSVPILTILFLLTLLVLVLALTIWRIILKEETKVETRYRNVIYAAAAFTVGSGVFGLVTYIIEIILASGILGTAYYELDLVTSQDSLWMSLTFFTKLGHNVFALAGCLVTGFAWTRQFRKWARFTNAPIVKSFFFAGITMILLFFVQLATISLQYLLFWTNPGEPLRDHPPEIQAIFIVLLITAMFVVPVYIYFLARAGQDLRMPFEERIPKSRIAIILPLIFFLLWFIVNMMNVGGDNEPSSVITTLLGNGFLVAAFIPISIGFIRYARGINSLYLRKNLYIASVGTLALSTFSIVGPNRWTGMAVLTGYLLAFSVLIWSLVNISQFLGSREALSDRLRDSGAKFLSDLGEAELIGQSVQQLTKVLAAVSKDLMNDLVNVDVKTPPTNEEIKRYILSTMREQTTPSEEEVMQYLEDALRVVKTI